MVMCEGASHPGLHGARVSRRSRTIVRRRHVAWRRLGPGDGAMAFAGGEGRSAPSRGREGGLGTGSPGEACGAQQVFFWLAGLGWTVAGMESSRVLVLESG